MPGPTSVPSDAQAGWHRGQQANSVLCLRYVVVARAFDNLELWVGNMCVMTPMKCPHLLSNGLNGQLSRSGSFSQH